MVTAKRVHTVKRLLRRRRSFSLRCSTLTANAAKYILSEIVVTLLILLFCVILLIDTFTSQLLLLLLLRTLILTSPSSFPAPSAQKLPPPGQDYLVEERNANALILSSRRALTPFLQYATDMHLHISRSRMLKHTSYQADFRRKPS